MDSLVKLFASVAKELRIILRDRAALALLFVMPLGFVTIMSLALQGVLAQPDAAARSRFSIAVLDGDRGEVSQAIIDELARLDFVRVSTLPVADFQQAATQLRHEVRAGHQRLGLIIPAGVSAKLNAVLASGDPRALINVPADEKIPLDLLVDPALRADFRLLVTVAIERILQAIEFRRAAARFARLLPLSVSRGDATASRQGSGLMVVNTRVPEVGSGKEATNVAPTAAQQNVPAYSLLAIFMLVVPLSQTFIRERTQGSLTRLRSMPVPGWVIVGGKFLPYFLINLLQMALCLGVGRFVLPLLGGSALQIGHAPGGVVLLSAAASVAAIGFALMVAMFVRTAEQATAFGATAILLLAALGGIMVPRMLMPPVMQKIGLISPLGWAQEGFLDLFVRGASAVDVLGHAGALVGFALVCMALAGWRFAKLNREC